MVTDSRSYGGIETSTDHKMVKMSFRMEWWKIRSFKPPKPKPDLQKLQQAETRTEYKREIKEKVTQYQTEDKNATQIWETITDICESSAKKILGFTKQKSKKHNNNEVKDLSEKQKQIRIQAESTQDAEKRRSLKKERNKIMNEIKVKINKLEEEKLEQEIADLEKYKDDSNKYKTKTNNSGIR